MDSGECADTELRFVAIANESRRDTGDSVSGDGG